jgi:hypothetical protein
MAILLAAADSNGLAMAGDSWMLGDDGTVENSDAVTVMSVFGRYLVGFAGAEPAGDSARWEVVDAWASSQSQEILDKVRAQPPNVEELHEAITDVVLGHFGEEHPGPGASALVTLGYGIDGAGHICQSEFDLKEDEIECEMSVLEPSTVELEEFSVVVMDVAAGTAWWQPYFQQALESAHNRLPPAEALSVALLDTVQAVIADDERAGSFGGRCRAGSVTAEGAVAVVRDSSRMGPPSG